ncbi:nicotinate (nicotinamide) nucleotide adenylyltransferase [Marinilabilia salmonicolor]|uniref:nicotinate (nicotinamide) nucleotide adenylyltransferase n=1 Tax=Marinilabilia salmonicolor TaxID=989 RepID=UPI00029A5737|nr:nicotinate (nicotinamide) nucleotide adenylyltransferase [Marinilabilia salmonicolor]
MQETGLLFGSFNPIHIGHLALANYLLEYTSLDEIQFIVSPQNPFKEQSDLADGQHRLQMVRMAISREKRFTASDIEFDMPLPSYTSKTLELLKKANPDQQFTLIIGSDNLLVFPRWHEANKILEEFHILVYPRPGFPAEDAEKDILNKVTLVDAPLLDISSTLIRKAFFENKKLPYLVTHDVYDYINKNKLYQK